MADSNHTMSTPNQSGASSPNLSANPSPLNSSMVSKILNKYYNYQKKKTKQPETNLSETNLPDSNLPDSNLPEIKIKSEGDTSDHSYTSSVINNFGVSSKFWNRSRYTSAASSVSLNTDLGVIDECIPSNNFNEDSKK